MKRNLENIIDFSHSRSTTDISAIFISINASDQSAEEFIREIQEGQLTQEKVVARLVDIISDHKSSQGVLIVGNKRMHLRYDQSIVHAMSEITQIGESQSFFLPQSFTGTSQQCQRIANILEDKLLKLIPIDINRLEVMQEISAPKPQISSSLISRFSIRQRAKQESLIINHESFSESLREVTQDAPMGAGLAQLLIQGAEDRFFKQIAASQEIESQNKREHVQGEQDFVTDDYDSPYLRQVKRMLTRDFESGKKDGKLVAIQSLRDTEEIANSILSYFYQKPSGIIEKEDLGSPKIVIIASQNKRLEQIQDTIEHQFIKEVADPRFKLYKSMVSKASKQKSMKKEQEKHESFREIFDVNQVFVLLDKKFFRYLTYGELDISEVDYLIFDETHSIYAESSYVDIMNKFIFNHTLMLSPAKNPDLLEDKRLPKVLAFFTLDSVLQAAQNIDSQIMKKFYFLANTFNASLLCIQKQDLVKIESDIAREFNQNRVRNIEDVSHLADQAKISLEFSQKARKYLSLRRDGNTQVTCLPQNIIQKKQLQSYNILQAQFAKITLDEAMYVLQDLGAEKQGKLYKVIVESSQWVINKNRYFSSRIMFDEPLVQLLGLDNVKHFGSQISSPSSRDKSDDQPFWRYSRRIYLKKTQSESQAALEMCQILYSQGFLDQYLRPALIRQGQPIQLSSASTNFSDTTSISTTCTSHHLQHQKREEDKSQAQFLSSEASTDCSSTASKIENTSSSKMNADMNYVYQMLTRAIKVNPNNKQVLEESNNFFYQKNSENKVKLEEGINKGQHHMPIMHYNTSQLELFIQNILNPILKALNEYNELCNTTTLDLIKFDDQNVNMISESSIKDLLFQECFNEKQENRKVNMFLTEFKNYRQRMFNIYDKNNEQRNEQQYPQLVQMIDQSLERYKFPHYMTQHIKNYHRQERGKTSLTAPQVEEVFNRKTFLTMLMIALSDKEPSTMEFERVKNEMGRLAFVGDSIIILCQVITMIFDGKKSFTEKDLDAVKNQIVKTENLKQRAQKNGLDYLRIKAKYYQKTAPNPFIEDQQKFRDLGDVIKSLAGLFSIYLGFGATYLLLSDFGIVEPPTKEKMIEIGEFSVAQKIKILDQISKNRRDLLDHEREKKLELFKILCDQQYLGLHQEPLAGSEIVEIWMKMLKSRGLYMKNDLTSIFEKEKKKEQKQDLNRAFMQDLKSKEDNSLVQLRDFSIAVSYKTTTLKTEVQQSETEEQKSATNQAIGSYESISDIKSDEYKPTDTEEEKKQQPLDGPFITLQLIQNLIGSQIVVDENASTVASSIKSKCSKFTDQHTITGDEELSKTGGQVIDDGIFDEKLEHDQRQVDIFEREYNQLLQEGYDFKNQELMMQSLVHKSYSEKLFNSSTQLKDSSLIEKDIIMQYNLQILEYLGDSILNFTISKLFYCETAENYQRWHGDFFVPTKLHELKTWFSSNNWLSFALYENYYCTITEEIRRDEQFKKSKFFKLAQQSIDQLQNKKITEKQSIELAPRVPLIYDKNDKFEEQINEFNGSCFRQCLAADKNEKGKLKNYPQEGLKVTSKSLSLKQFKDKDVQQQDQNEVDFSEIDEKFVKYFPDVMEALIGGIFMDSGDLDKTQMILLKLINCPSVSSFPIVQHDRTAVLSVFNSKPYCKGIKLYHTLEEKDGSTYIMGYMGKLQFRRLKYSKERKKKVLLFYYDMRLYLEDAYKEFEMKFVSYRKEDDKREPTNDEWLEFNKDYRKTWKVKVYSADQKRFSAIKEAAKILYKIVCSAKDDFKTRETQNIPEMREQIIKCINEGLETIKANSRYSLLILESERVQSSRIRELLQSSDIKFIDCLSYNMKSVGNFIHKLNNRQVHQFYEHLIEFGKN